MKSVIAYLLFLFVIVALYGAAFASVGEEPAGKKVFLDSKCNTCHAIQVAKIETKSKKPAPDLSAVGSKHKADFIKKYITKQEKVNDKAHPTQFKGSDDDLKKVAEWLGSLKTAKK